MSEKVNLLFYIEMSLSLNGPFYIFSLLKNLGNYV